MLSGILFALAFPPFGWVVLLPLALVPWLVALAREESRWRALLSGLLFGLATGALSISWITYVVTHFGGQGRAMGVVCLVLLAAILAEWPAAVALGTAVACAPAGIGAASRGLSGSLDGVGALRSFVYGGFPWNLTGHALYRRPIWLQTASIGGVYRVGGLLVAVSCLLAAAVAFRRAKPLVAAAVLVLAAGAFGAARLARRRDDGAARDASRSPSLQPNVSQESRPRRERRRGVRASDRDGARRGGREAEPPRDSPSPPFRSTGTAARASGRTSRPSPWPRAVS